MSVTSVVRADNWWASKIPPLLAVAYAEVLLLDFPPARSFQLLVVALVGLIGVASYGHIINDAFDIEADRRAGKRNFMAPLRPWQRVALTLISIAVGFAPLAFIRCGWIAPVALAVNYLLPTVYSIPPARLKSRGVLGAICDSSGVHFVPTVFVATTFLGAAPTIPATALRFTLAVSAWAFVFGIRGIVSHQLHDLEGDLRAGDDTLAAKVDPRRAWKFVIRVLYPVELPLFLAVLWTCWPVSKALAAGFVVFVAIELAKRFQGWNYSFDASGQLMAPNLPLANNRFYELWWPTILALELIPRGRGFILAPIAHTILFWPNLRDQIADLARLARDISTPLRHRRQWRRFQCRLDAIGETSARVTESAAGVGVVRVEIDRRDDDPWHIKLSMGRVVLASQKPHTVHFRARAACPRPVTVNISKFLAPWDGLGLTEEVELSTDWQSYAYDFFPIRAESDACVAFWLGGADGAVEFADVAVTPISVAQAWRLFQLGEARAHRFLPSDGSRGARVAPRSIDGDPEHLKLSLAPFALEAGRAYVARFAARADAPRSITVVVGQSRTPWADLGLSEELLVGRRWRHEAITFVAWRDEPAAGLNFWLGGEKTPLEIADAALESAGSPRVWAMERQPGCVVRRRRSLEGADAIRLDVDRVSGVNWHVKLVRSGFSTERGQAYRLSFRARADRPRRVTVGVGQAIEPWTELGLQSSIDLDETWRTRVETFVATAEQPAASVYFWLGEEAIGVEIADVSLEPASIGCVWLLERFDDARAQRLESASDSDTVRVQLLATDGAPDHVQLGRRGLKLRAGEWRRVEFTGKADGAHPIVFGVGRPDGQREGLGLTERAELSTTTKQFICDFRATEDAEDARAFFHLGGRSGAVELSTFRFEPLQEPVGWVLDHGEATSAQRIGPPTRSGAARVEILAIDNDPASVKLRRDVGSLDADRWYRLTFDARADRIREITDGVCQSRPPWRELGLEETVRVTTEWARFVADFHTSGAEEEASLYFWLGQSVGEVEIGGVRLDPIEKRRGWSLERSEPAIARRVASNEGDDAIRVFVDETDGTSWHVKVARRGIPLHAKKAQRLRVRARSDKPRKIRVGVGQSHPPWDDLGLGTEVAIESNWNWIIADFIPTADEPDATLYFWIGESTGETEFADLSLTPLVGENPWLLDHHDACAAQRTCGDNGDRPIRVVINQADGEKGHVKLSRGQIALRGGEWHTLTLDARSSRPLAADVGIGRPVEPWDNLGLHQSIELTPESPPRAFEFFAGGDELDARAYLLLGAAPGAVDVSEFSVEPGRGLGPWIVEQSGLAKALRLAGEGIRVSVDKTDGVADHVRLVCPNVSVDETRATRLTFRAKVDWPTKIIAGLGQRHPPWSDLAPRQPMTLDEHDRAYVVDFLPIAGDAEAALWFLLGFSAAELAISRPRLAQIPLSQAWFLDVAEEASARRLEASTPDNVRIQVYLPGDRAWQVKLWRRGPSVQAGHVYRVNFRARSLGAAEANLTIGVGQSREPWSELAPTIPVTVGTDWTSIEEDLIANADESGATLFLLLGDGKGEIEVAELTLAPTAWLLERAVRSAGRRQLSKEPGVVKVEIAEAGSADSVRLALPNLPLAAGVKRPARVMIRADQPRLVDFALVAEDNPWRELDWKRRASARSDWREIAFDLLSTETTTGRLVARLGEAAGVVEFKLTALEDGGAVGPWVLETNSPSAARWSTALDPEGVAVVVERSSDADPWSVRLSRRGLSVEKGAWYRVRFKIRASDYGRPVVVLQQAREPWSILGLNETIEVREEWTDWHWVVMDIVPTATEKDARLVFCLGNCAARVEIAALSMQRGGVDGPWKIDAASNYHATREPGSLGPDAIKVLVWAPGPDAWGVKLAREELALAQGRDYQLRFRARASSPRSITVAIGQSTEPWAMHGLCQDVALDDQWRTFTLSFAATATDSNALLAFWVGRDAGEIEFADVVFELAPPAPPPAPPPPSDGWELGCGAGALGVLLRPKDQPGSLRVDVRRLGSGEPWQVQLHHRGFAVTAGRRLRLRFRAESPIERPACVSVGQSEEPWASLGLYERFVVSPVEAEYSLSFTAAADEPNARIHFDLGEAEGSLTLRDIVLEPEPAPVEQVAESHPTSAPPTESAPADASTNGSCSTVMETLGAPAGVSAPEASPTEALASPGEVDAPSIDDAQGPRSEDSTSPGLAAETPVESPAPPELANSSDVPQWRTSSRGGAEAESYRVDDVPEGYGILVRKLGTGEPWQAQFVLPGVSVTKDQRLVLEFLARSGEPRTAFCSVSQAHDPWKNLGLYRELELSTQWERQTIYFTATADDDNARIHLDVGHALGLVEVAGAILREGEPEPPPANDEPRSRPWRLWTHEPARAEIVNDPSDPSVVRIAINPSGDGKAWEIQLSLPEIGVERGKSYALCFRARAERNRTAVCCVGQASAPWENLGLREEVSLSTDWREYRLEFVATGDEERGRVQFNLGADAASVDLADVRLESVAIANIAEEGLSPPTATP